MTTLKDIPLKLIRTQGEGWDRCVFNASPQVDELAESIGRVGLNNPLTVIESKGAYRIVCGYARALAAQRMNWWTVPCFLADGKELGDEKLLRISVEDNRFSRKYHYLDVARILAAFSERCGYDAERLAREIAPLLGIPSGGRIVQQYLALNKMPASLRGMLVREGLGFAHAVLLVDLSPEDAEAIAGLFSRDRVNANEAKEITGMLRDLAHIRRVSVKDLLAAEGLNGLTRDALRKNLKKMRYPTIAAAEEKFEKLVAQLHLDTNTSVSHSPDFESDSLRININVRSAAELSSVLKKLSTGLESGVIGEIFDIPRRANRPHNNA